MQEIEMKPLQQIGIFPIDESPSENAVYMYSRGNTLEYQGLFSFAFYYHKTDKPVQETHWYRGLNVYLQIIHNIDYTFYKDVGVVIYTDLHTFHILREMDEWKQFPKLVFAVTVWRRYQAEPNKVEGTIMRCMRYHALQAFPGAWIAIRDADTLFQNELGFRSGAFGLTYIDPMKPTLPAEIALWEETFLRNFFERIEQSICIGVGMYYQRPWHSNVKRNYTIKMNKTIFGKYNPSNYKKPRRNIIFASDYGAYAGFVTCKSEPQRPTHIWKNIVEYLVPRYKMIAYDGKTMISNALQPRTAIGKDERIILFSIIRNYLDDCYFFALSNNMGEYSVASFYSYNQTSKWSKEEYDTISKNIQTMPLLNPESIDQVLRLNSHQMFYNYFKQLIQEYINWLETYDENEKKYKQIYASKLEKVKPGYEEFINGPYDIPRVPVTESNLFLNVPNALEHPINTLNLQNVYNNVPAVPNVSAVSNVPAVNTKCKAGKCSIMGGTRKRLQRNIKKTRRNRRNRQN